MKQVRLACAVQVLVVVACATPALATGWRDASATLPPKEAPGNSMNAVATDADGDGDLDLLVPMEFRSNRLLLNDGRGLFSDASAQLPRTRRDSEDMALIDVDRDGDLDVAVASEDDIRPELYLNEGRGQYRDVSDRLPIRVKANAVVALDANRDGNTDLFFGGDGVSILMIGDGRGGFADRSLERLPDTSGSNQDVAVGDIDRDGDPDLVLGNQDANQIYLNDGRGVFALAARSNLPRPARPEETRDVELFDADGDGDLDIMFANVEMFNAQAHAQNRLLLNDGAGSFTDVTSTWLPVNSHSDMSALPVDLDGDGRLDLITTSLPSAEAPTSPIRAWRNTGSRFEEMTAAVLPAHGASIGIHALAADFDGDGKDDLFVAGFRSPDLLFLSRPAG